VAILVYFVAVWYIFPVLVHWSKKNLATQYLPVAFGLRIDPGFRLDDEANGLGHLGHDLENKV
jgi:hypothetical protein